MGVELFLQVLVVSHPFITDYTGMFCITKRKYQLVEKLKPFLSHNPLFHTKLLQHTSIEFPFFSGNNNFFYCFFSMHAWVPNNTILFFPLPYIMVKLLLLHHMLSIIIICHWYTSSWYTMFLVPNSFKCSTKGKPNPSTRFVCLTEMRITLSLVSKMVDPIIRYLWSFTKSGSTVSPTWRRTYFSSSYSA